jgi:hypothetical protein
LNIQVFFKNQKARKEKDIIRKQIMGYKRQLNGKNNSISSKIITKLKTTELCLGNFPVLHSITSVFSTLSYSSLNK